MRLGGLLRTELRKGSEAERFIQEAILRAIREVTEEQGFGEEQGKGGRAGEGEKRESANLR